MSPDNFSSANIQTADSQGPFTSEADRKVAQACFDYAFNGIIVTDTDLTILRANPAACSIVGLPRHRLLTKRFPDVLDASAESGARAGRHFSLLSEQGISRSELQLPPSAGNALRRVIEIGSIDIGDGHLLHLFDDVTERRQLMLATEQARFAADEANRAKSTFLANMSHEIRTPLNGVIGLGEVLRLTRLDAQQKDYVNKILQSSQALLAILNDLLDLSKIEAGHMTFEFQPIVLAELLEEVAATTLALSRAKGIEAVFEVDQNTPPRIMGDRLRLMQVIRNLLGNAVKFTSRGSVGLNIDSVGPLEGKAWVRLRITDTGIGMSLAQSSRVFQPFSQGDASTARRFGGTGLGLAISRMLTEGMGGRIELSSEVNRGSTVTVWLPLSIAEGAATVNDIDDEISLARNEFQGSRVLVAEDNAINREVIGQLLRHAGIDVIPAVDGVEALRLLDRQLPDLVIMDVQMPGVDGLSATRILRNKGFQLPIVALSAGVSSTEREACESAGMNDFLAKPINLGDLAAVLTRWLPPRDTLAAEHIPTSIKAPVDDGDFPGLMIEEALPRFLGKREILVWARDTLVNQHRESPAHLRAFAAESRWAEMARITHALRGAAANIGAIDLARQARLLEESLDLRDPSVIHPLIESLRIALEKLSQRSTPDAQI